MLPLLYHTHHSRYMEDLAFWSGLASRQKGPILELGCGTGRLGIALAQEGYFTVGLDLDYDSLAFFRNSLPDSRNRVPFFFQADLSAYCLGIPFSLVFLPCNTYSSLPHQVRNDGIERAFAHLQPGGIFAVSMPNPSVLQSLPSQVEPEEEDEFFHPVTGNPVIVSSTWEKSKGTVRFRWIYDHLFPNGESERTELGITHFIRPRREYLDELRSAGFEIQAQYGDYDESMFRSSSPYLIILARRP